jgi:hypothetical protein
MPVARAIEGDGGFAMFMAVSAVPSQRQEERRARRWATAP